jgi:hypothetical protein
MIKGKVAYRDSDRSLQRIWAQCDRYDKPRYSKNPTDKRKSVFGDGTVLPSLLDRIVVIVVKFYWFLSPLLEISNH